MSGAGPAAPPAPAITSPARASTWISLKPRSAAKQGLEPRMWRSTADRWRNSPRLERWPVAVQWTQTKRPTGAGGTALSRQQGLCLEDASASRTVQSGRTGQRFRISLISTRSPQLIHRGDRVRAAAEQGRRRPSTKPGGLDDTCEYFYVS